jgi:CHAT domain-containing protein
LTTGTSVDVERGTLLAVGNVDYNDSPNATPNEPILLATRGVVRGNQEIRWQHLPATRTELDEVIEAAGPRDCCKLMGAEAGTDRVVSELPRARFAHFATHGFFVDASVQSALRLHADAFEKRNRLYGDPRTSVGGRNPLVLSGLVLAGANLRRSQDKSVVAQGDVGILAAEAIAALPLDNLDLVVLSACETGLGDVAGGEGVLGLQRAFHLAGARNTIASLWKVDDRATSVLMRLFYHKLWRDHESPMEALREAQLALYRDSSLVDRLVDLRGVDFSEAVPLPDVARPQPESPRAPTRLWAGFVLSGPGS